ncbi:hypothetical protein PTSG_02347 [Salpingoeca rosetta]|uniref:Uncharacterized protein n=1 Tax=Salpingoeca rosetta (strain ATCC 50818 / BSB-021) TaxID=946362 RepID=F2U1X9_SALR5|nr:uncharacterized protein PTSG_02347 [Salpingoeca rosetta]EGD81631.1 hypothetical protein PTSG_02347 [Salpingoeca rosetta]|eukprot:XP_004996835.1 hypothetical protein PTSG_02347 [Salpingoeca rosetta]
MCSHWRAVFGASCRSKRNRPLDMAESDVCFECGGNSTYCNECTRCSRVLHKQCAALMRMQHGAVTLICVQCMQPHEEAPAGFIPPSHIMGSFPPPRKQPQVLVPETQDSSASQRVQSQGSTFDETQSQDGDIMAPRSSQAASASDSQDSNTSRRRVQSQGSTFDETQSQDGDIMAPRSSQAASLVFGGRPLPLSQSRVGSSRARVSASDSQDSNTSRRRVQSQGSTFDETQSQEGDSMVPRSSQDTMNPTQSLLAPREEPSSSSAKRSKRAGGNRTRGKDANPRGPLIPWTRRFEGMTLDEALLERVRDRVFTVGGLSSMRNTDWVAIANELKSLFDLPQTPKVLGERCRIRVSRKFKEQFKEARFAVQATSSSGSGSRQASTLVGELRAQGNTDERLRRACQVHDDLGEQSYASLSHLFEGNVATRDGARDQSGLDPHRRQARQTTQGEVDVPDVLQLMLNNVLEQEKAQTSAREQFAALIASQTKAIEEQTKTNKEQAQTNKELRDCIGTLVAAVRSLRRRQDKKSS